MQLNKLRPKSIICQMVLVTLKIQHSMVVGVAGMGVGVWVGIHCYFTKRWSGESSLRNGVCEEQGGGERKPQRVL